MQTGEPELQNHLTGVLAIALTEKEEYVKHYRQRTLPGGIKPPKRELIEIGLTVLNALLTDLPLVVIQSTHDRYLPASEARALFGPDRELQKLIPVDAHNHSFHGGCSVLFGQMRESLAWLCSNPSGTAAKQKHSACFVP